MKLVPCGVAGRESELRPRLRPVVQAEHGDHLVGQLGRDGELAGALAVGDLAPVRRGARDLLQRRPEDRAERAGRTAGADAPRRRRRSARSRRRPRSARPSPRRHPPGRRRVRRLPRRRSTTVKSMTSLGSSGCAPLAPGAASRPAALQDGAREFRPIRSCPYPCTRVRQFQRPVPFPAMSDPLAPLSDLPGVAERVTAAREAVDAVLNHRALRRRSADVSAESSLRGAWLSASLSGLVRHARGRPVRRRVRRPARAGRAARVRRDPDADRHVDARAAAGARPPARARRRRPRPRPGRARPAHRGCRAARHPRPGAGRDLRAGRGRRGGRARRGAVAGRVRAGVRDRRARRRPVDADRARPRPEVADRGRGGLPRGRLRRRRWPPTAAAPRTGWRSGCAAAARPSRSERARRPRSARRSPGADSNRRRRRGDPRRRRDTVGPGYQACPADRRTRSASLPSRVDTPVAWWDRRVGARSVRAERDPLGAGPPWTCLVRARL